MYPMYSALGIRGTEPSALLMRYVLFAATVSDDH